MRSITLIGAIILAGAVGAIGAFSWNARVVSMQAAMTDAQNPPSLHSIQDIQNFFKQYPSFTCNGGAASFSYAESEDVYHHGDKLRVDFTNVSGQQVTHLILTDDGLYVWQDGATEIDFVTPEHFADQFAKNDLVPAALFSQSSCSPWWLPDDSVFNTPALPYQQTTFSS